MPAGYIGVDGTAKKIKKMYVGIDGVARKVKKAYIGVNGVAKLWFRGIAKTISEGKASFTSRNWIAGAKAGAYALFAGGYYNQLYSSVNAVSEDFTVHSASSLNEAKQAVAAASLGDKAFFVGGGQASSNAKRFSTCEIYNSSLTKSLGTASSYERSYASATVAGERVLVAGGITWANALGFKNTGVTVDSYYSSGTRGTVSDLSQGRMRAMATTLNGCAIFAGGDNGDGSVYATVDAYNASLTKVSASSLYSARSRGAAAASPYIAIFFGGQSDSSMNGSSISSAIDIFNTSLTRITVSQSLKIPNMKNPDGFYFPVETELTPNGSIVIGCSTAHIAFDQKSGTATMYSDDNVALSSQSNVFGAAVAISENRAVQQGRYNGTSFLKTYYTKLD